MIIKYYQDIEVIKLPDNFKQLYITSTVPNKYVQQLKLGFLFGMQVYKGNQKLKNFHLEVDGQFMGINNMQLAFLPADVYYKRDVEYGTNSIIKNVLLNVMENNPQYIDGIQQIYQEINRLFGVKIFEKYSNVEIVIEADDINLKEIIDLLEISLYNDKNVELKETDVTEFELKMLYLKILQQIIVHEGQKLYYLIESPEAGLNYQEKMLFMDSIEELNNVIIFTNDIDILGRMKGLNQLHIINRSSYYEESYVGFIEEIGDMFLGRTPDQIYLEVSKVISENLDYIIRKKDINEIKDLKVKNIVLNFINYVDKNVII